MPTKCLRLVLAFVGMLVFGPAAFAGYAQVAVPPGIVGSPGGYGYAAANASEMYGASVRVNAALSVGREVTIPAVMRFAANAPLYAARSAFLNPYAIAATGVAWLATECIAYDGGQWQIVCGPELNTENYPVSSGYVSAVWNGGGPFYDADSFCTYALSYYKSRGYPSATQTGCSQTSTAFRLDFNTGSTNTFASVNFSSSSSCPSGWYVTPAGCVQNPPPVDINQADFETRVSPKIDPAKIPDYFPEFKPIPLDNPILNPDQNGNPQPIVVPTGDPYPVPNTNPQKYRQPIVTVVPSPTPSEPWRVDLQPGHREALNPSDLTTTTPNPAAPPTPSEFITCGLPGTPACKINEEGTPDQAAVDVKNIPQALDEYKESEDEAIPQVSGTGDKGFLDGFKDFFLLPPLAACSPFQLPQFRGQAMGQIDPCEVVEGVRSVMGYIWALTALWLCIGMVRKVIVS